MDQYADRPMDLADATLVASAEERGDRRIFTLDTDFQIYRFRGRQRFETIPATTATRKSNRHVGSRNRSVLVEVLGHYSNLVDQGERVRCILEMVPNGSTGQD